MPIYMIEDIQILIRVLAIACICATAYCAVQLMFLQRLRFGSMWTVVTFTPDTTKDITASPTEAHKPNGMTTSHESPTKAS